MRFSGNFILAILLLLCCNTLAADQASVADSILIKGGHAQCWDQGDTSVVELTGPVHIELDGTKMSAANAVVWIEPNPGGPADSHKVQISLIGSGVLQQDGVLRMDRRLLVNAVVTGNIKLVADRTIRADESSDLYKDASALRDGKPSTSNPASTSAPTTTTAPVEPQPLMPGGIVPLAPLPGTTQATTGPVIPQSPWLKQPVGPIPTAAPATTAPAAPAKVIEFDGDYERATTPDGNIAAVITNHATLSYRDAQQNLIEFVSQNMVVFTNLKDMKGLGEGEDRKHFIADHIVSAYFEGDVQVYMTPASAASNELRMRAEHVYYEFATDRAIMTDVVFHTVDLKKNLPIFMRAAKLRQLSQGEYNLENLELTDSAFAAPTYSIRAAHAYVRTEDTGDTAQGEQVTFNADNTTLDAVGIPFFYFPVLGGTMDTKGFPLRTFNFNNNNQYGVGARTKWGLFETVGVVPPKDLDVTYSLDYLNKRGPAGGLDATFDGYNNGFVTDATRQPWNFNGDFHSYIVDDHGTDVLGAARSDEKPTDTLRGRAMFEVQSFLPADWQAQLRLGWVSDSNFMAQWFNDEYLNNLPVDDSFYMKHAHDSESFSFLAEGQFNRAISSADEEQQNKEVSRLPEITYYRIGDSIANDHLTFFSENSGSELKFVRNTQTLAQQGFYPVVEPGLASYAYTGDPGTTTHRGDFREELDLPINAGFFKAVPYAFVRYTPYSNSVIPSKNPPQNNVLPSYVEVGGAVNRIMAGGGVRLTTSFWKVDNTIESELFDIHRLRHIIEPEINIFAATSNVDQNRLFIYDPEVDGVNDITAVQLALRQRWQTKRGGPGRWRNVDVLTLNTYINYFGNQPSNRFRDPIDFRGLYFYGTPEASIPRNSANADLTWRISDSTAVLADVEQNLDKVRLATAAIGLAVMRDQRLSYFIGTRYIADLNSNIITIEANYKLDDKYSIALSQSFDLAQSKDVFYSFSLTRNFDNLSMSARFYFDQSTNDSGFSFNIQPFGIGRSVNADQTGVEQ